MELLNKVLKKNLPKNDAEKKANEIVKRINSELAKQEIKAKAMLGGSLGKNTHLNNFDCDIFVKFDLMYKKKSLSEMLEKVLIKHKPTRVHGSRDYFQFKHKGMDFEIVPVLDIKHVKNIVNVTDMSPFHVDWVNKNIKKLNDEVRLAKLFCKANYVYGAESYIQGFSGYILEILIIKYGGFLQMLKAISKWKPKQVIDIEHHFKRNDALNILNSSKTHGPLIIIDPVQKDRNAAAALNTEKFSKMILLAKLFLDSPDKSFFEKKRFDVKEIKKEAKEGGYETIILKVKPLEGKRDVVGTKILRVMNLIKKQIELNEFNVFDNGFDWEEGKDAVIWFLIWPNKLPKYKKHQGPKVYSDNKNVFNFIDKHSEIMLKDYTIYAKVKRKYIDVKSLVKAIIKEDFIKDKVNKINLH